MKEIRIGLKISEEAGVYFFGIEEVNAEVKKGKKVIQIQEGDVFMNRQETDGEDVELTLAGFSMKVMIE